MDASVPESQRAEQAQCAKYRGERCIQGMPFIARIDVLTALPDSFALNRITLRSGDQRIDR